MLAGWQLTSVTEMGEHISEMGLWMAGWVGTLGGIYLLKEFTQIAYFIGK